MLLLLVLFVACSAAQDKGMCRLHEHFLLGTDNRAVLCATDDDCPCACTKDGICSEQPVCDLGLPDTDKNSEVIQTILLVGTPVVLALYALFACYIEQTPHVSKKDL